MKPFLAYLLTPVAAVVFLLVIYVLYQVISLDILSPNHDIPVHRMSSDEMREDFSYLTQLVQDVYPYSGYVKESMGLDNILDLEGDYIRRAEACKDNAEFLELFYEYMIRLSHAGHAFVVYESQYNPVLGYLFGIPKTAYRRSNEWRGIASGMKLYAHAPVRIKYMEGKYILADAYRHAEGEIPSGSVLEEIDGLNVDAFVLALQNRHRLRYDPKHGKVYLHSPFVTFPEANKPFWTVRFRSHDGNAHYADIPVLNGYRNAAAVQPRERLVCRELSPQTGYIYIRDFEYQHIEHDYQVIQQFMADSGGRYERLILDVRKNSGGELSSWMENIIRPLLQEPVVLRHTSMLKKGFFKNRGIRHPLYGLLVNNDLLDRKIHHVTRIRKVRPAELDPGVWQAFQVERTLYPDQPFPFEGQVFLLVDSDSFSAADGLADAFKQTGLGRVIGVPTAGAGCSYAAPVSFSLPNSGLMFKMDVEFTRNGHGEVNQIFGTIPDVVFESSMYPTPFPLDFSVETLLKDPWIQWAMENNPVTASP